VSSTRLATSNLRSKKRAKPPVISIVLHVQLMEMPIGEEMNMLCQRYDGLSRAANLLERLTEGSIPVPE
jgi:hypothetical protein